MPIVHVNDQPINTFETHDSTIESRLQQLEKCNAVLDVLGAEIITLRAEKCEVQKQMDTKETIWVKEKHDLMKRIEMFDKDCRSIELRRLRCDLEYEKRTRFAAEAELQAFKKQALHLSSPADASQQR